MQMILKDHIKIKGIWYRKTYKIKGARGAVFTGPHKDSDDFNILTKQNGTNTFTPKNKKKGNKFMKSQAAEDVHMFDH